MKENRGFFLKLLMILVALSIVPQLKAQEYFRINYKNGTVVEIEISTIQKITFDKLTDINEFTPLIDLLLKMKLYPNPNTSFINIDYVLPITGEVDLELISIEGRLLKRFNLGTQSAGSHTYQLKTNYLETGNYVCTIHQNKYSASKIIIVKH
ncbi:MAG TPA: T9SS type A sorting domain-containing protein [Bacteroidales bacterium]|nr:T9SS type A sorting domain-containing protein [Bacteroidales bacterium]